MGDLFLRAGTNSSAQRSTPPPWAGRAQVLLALTFLPIQALPPDESWPPPKSGMVPGGSEREGPRGGQSSPDLGGEQNPGPTAAPHPTPLPSYSPPGFPAFCYGQAVILLITEQKT